MATIVVSCVFFPAFAAAHAFLDHAEPRVGAKVSKAPEEIRLWFTQAIEPAFSKVAIFDSDGNRIETKEAHTDGKDRKVLVVSLPSLTPGTYKVSWRVVSTDTHRTQGDFQFVVQP